MKKNHTFEAYNLPLNRTTLTEKMVLYFLTLGIGAIILTGYFSFYSARSALLSRTFEQLTSLRLANQARVESFFNDRLKETEKIASSPELNELTAMIQDNRKNISLQKLFNTTNIGYYGEVFITDCSGKILTGSRVDSSVFSDNISLNSVWPGKQKKFSFILDYCTSDTTNKYKLFAVARIQNENDCSVYLALEISSIHINNLLRMDGIDRGFGLSGETYMIGRDGLMRSQSRFIPSSIMTISVTSDAINSINGETEEAIISDYRGVKVLSSFGKLSIEGLEWTMISEIDYQEAIAPVNAIRNSIMLLTVIAAVVFFIITYLISLKITAPLIRLKNAAVELGEGNYTGQLTDVSNDEIGELTEAFNKMSVKLLEKDAALKTEKYNRLRSTIDGQDIERQRLSRELHDGIGQNLIAVRLKLGAIEDNLSTQENEKIKSVIVMADNLIDEVRAISNALMPPALHEFGLNTAVRQLCNTLYESKGIVIDFQGEISGTKLSRKSRLYVFRVIQEIINNVAKHSEADKLTLSAGTNEEDLTIIISDNGKGFNTSSPCSSSGHGISNIKERIDLIKGALTMVSSEGNGTYYKITIPVNKPQNDKHNPC
jgi:signal transduction histidine kinase